MNNKKLIKIEFACLILCLMVLFLVVITGAKQDSEALESKGTTLFQSAKYDKALEAFDKAIEINPRDSVAWYNKGFALRKLGKSDEAIKAYDKAIEINPQDSRVWDGKGGALMELGKSDEAIKAFDKALEINPVDSVALAAKMHIWPFSN